MLYSAWYFLYFSFKSSHSGHMSVSLLVSLLLIYLIRSRNRGGAPVEAIFFSHGHVLYVATVFLAEEILA